MKEGASIADYVNEFNLILSRLMSVDIKFDDDVHTLLLLSSLPESWKASKEYSNSLLSAEDKGKGRKQDRRQKQNRAEDYDDALVCCVKNTTDDRIMDSGTSFHATYFKEELESSSDAPVRYIPSLKKRLISIGQLDEEGYHVALWHQRLGHMSEKGMKILALKGRIPDLQKAVVGFCRSCYNVTFIDDSSRKNLKGHKVVRSKDVTFNKDSLYGAKATTYSNNLTKPNQKDQVSLGGSLDMSEGSKNSRSFKDSGRSDEEDSTYRASSEDRGFETLQSDYQHERRHYRVSGCLRLKKSRMAGKEQLDLKTTFFHGELDENIYMTQPEGFQSVGKKKPHVQVEEKSIQMKASIETMEKYIGKVLEKFNMKDAEARFQSLGDHFKLSKKQAPKAEASRRRMAKVPYASVVGSARVQRLCFDNGSTTVSWMSRIQKCVVMSTTESEYMAIVEAGIELVWLKNFLEKLERAQTEYVLFCDNHSAIHLAKNPLFHGRTKHIKIRYHYI
uniref:Retrovirus-related Pol polyprotein from transposon TNT 1-94 n=1 Tax=Tanacetum cinerariifolium TaxID=118510 RepID=A0A6L2NLM7_TANCI|nr:retrovirus-related Pol polyprotein from transposon TNT 1-94 [Tanacetum cinerariifolium]